MFSISGTSWVIQDLEAVIFDKDGTIADIHLYWGEIVRRRARAVIAHWQLAESLFPQICGAMGLSLAENRLLPQGPVGLASRDEIIQILCGHLVGCGVSPSTKTMAGLFNQVHEAFLPHIEDYLRIIPGVVTFVASLRQAGARLAVVTSDTAINARHSLEKFGISACFDVIVGRDTIPEPKTSGVPALKALKEMGRSSDKTVCVGDAPMDFLMAKASSCRAGIAVATGQTPISRLLQLTPYTADSMGELVANIRDYSGSIGIPACAHPFGEHQRDAHVPNRPNRQDACSTARPKHHENQNP